MLDASEVSPAYLGWARVVWNVGKALGLGPSLVFDLVETHETTCFPQEALGLGPSLCSFWKKGEQKPWMKNPSLRTKIITKIVYP
jgi:hypothetical protein